MNENIAVLHGNYFVRGGGERVADSLAQCFDAPLYFGFGDTDAPPDDEITRYKLFEPSWFGRKLVRNIHQYRDLRYMWHGMHRPELFKYDTIIQSGNEFGWYVPKRMAQTIVKYVHSPPRGPYDMHYKHGDSKLHRGYALAAKTLYGHTLDYVDTYVANSEVVAQRCRKAWGVEPEVVYPPVDVEEYGADYGVEEENNIFLTFSRLYRHKRTREIVQAFEDLDARLIVGGDGPQRETLEKIAPSNVQVWGYLSEETKRRLLAKCDALIFNAENEDFGIVPIEAFASGTPVIGVDDGFTAHQIQDGHNGILYDSGDDPRCIKDAVERFMSGGVTWAPHDFESHAKQFSRERFNDEMRTIVQDAQERNKISVQ